MIRVVDVTKRAEKSLLNSPKHVREDFLLWKRQVEDKGLLEIRKIPGYHDEALSGKLSGLRSIRLSRGYRAYYMVLGEIAKFVRVEEVNKHDYKKIERIFGR
jgi:proteic killer suppression protein